MDARKITVLEAEALDSELRRLRSIVDVPQEELVDVACRISLLKDRIEEFRQGKVTSVEHLRSFRSSIK
jgi:hypothetical protein